VGKYLTERLYLHYSRPILSAGETGIQEEDQYQEIGFTYRVTDYLDVSGKRTGDGETQLELKLQWDF